LKKTSCVQKPKPIPSGAGGSSRSSKEESARTQSREAYPATAPAPCHHIQPHSYILSSLFLSLTHMYLEPCNPPLSLSLSLYLLARLSIYLCIRMCTKQHVLLLLLLHSRTSCAVRQQKLLQLCERRRERKREIATAAGTRTRLLPQGRR
jgi:hypothetical protein